MEDAEQQLHPFTAFNKAGTVQAAHVPTLVGNWVEERALLASTGVSRYEPWVKDQDLGGSIYTARQDQAQEMPTLPRVILHGSDSEHRAHASGALQYKTAAQLLGPRTKLELEALQKLASDLPVQPASTLTNWGVAQQLDTTYRADFVPQDAAAAGNTIGTRCMRDHDGRPAVRDPTFLAETQLVPRPLGDRVFGTTAQLAGATRTMRPADPDIPITIYSEAVMDGRYGGNIAGTRPLGATKLFDKSLPFSKPMSEYSKARPSRLFCGQSCAVIIPGRSSRTRMAAPGRDAVTDVLAANQRLLDCILLGDYAVYQELCAPELSCFEPEACGGLVEGLAFHEFFFRQFASATPSSPSPLNTMCRPKVTLLGGGTVAVLAYTRLVQRVADGRPVVSRIEETRVWELRNGAWVNVHFHKSESSNTWP